MLPMRPAVFMAAPQSARSPGTSARIRAPRVRHISELWLPAPEERMALMALSETRPIPLQGDLRLRRTVLLTVVVGVAILLGYVSWQRVAHAAAPVAEAPVAALR